MKKLPRVHTSAICIIIPASAVRNQQRQYFKTFIKTTMTSDNNSNINRSSSFTRRYTTIRNNQGRTKIVELSSTGWLTSHHKKDTPPKKKRRRVPDSDSPPVAFGKDWGEMTISTKGRVRR